MELIKVDSSEFEIEEVKAKEISLVFTPIIEEMNALEEEYNEVIKLDPSKENCKKAKELRLKYVKTRTATGDKHKEEKSFYLNGGRFVDKWKNVQKEVAEQKEYSLRLIEDHYVNLERERLDKLQAERALIISKYEVETNDADFASMTDEIWNCFLGGAKADFEDRKEKERLVEEERLEAIRKVEKERERMRIENEKLKKEADEREAKIKKDNEERVKKENAERKEREDREEKIRKDQESKDKIENDKKEALEAKIKAQEDIIKTNDEKEKSKITCPHCNKKFNL